MREMRDMREVGKMREKFLLITQHALNAPLPLTALLTHLSELYAIVTANLFT
ncbi:hypothetical protein NSMS1_27050 [Nostoc sp. MS1]|nr:hypothetical protein NSMS1_27050 [Nostoc sp. MS1]